jgi:Ca2+-binding RTX toxin-like protein
VRRKYKLTGTCLAMVVGLMAFTPVAGADTRVGSATYDPCGFSAYTWRDDTTPQGPVPGGPHTLDDNSLYLQDAAVQATTPGETYVATSGYDLICVSAPNVTIYTLGIQFANQAGDHVRTADGRWVDGVQTDFSDASNLTIYGDRDPGALLDDPSDDTPITSVPSAGVGFEGVYRLYVQAFAATVVYGTNLEDDLYGGGIYANGAYLPGPDVTLYGNGGTDVISTWGGVATLYGGGGDDFIESFGVDGERTVQYGSAGSDTLSTSTDDSLLSGGYGADRLVAGASADDATLAGGGGSDTLTTSSDDSVLSGGTSADRLVARASADAATLKGGGGRDTLIARDADDTVFGGTGYDTCRVKRGVERHSCERVVFL